MLYIIFLCFQFFFAIFFLFYYFWFFYYRLATRNACAFPNNSSFDVTCADMFLPQLDGGAGQGSGGRAGGGSDDGTPQPPKHSAQPRRNPAPGTLLHVRRVDAR